MRTRADGLNRNTAPSSSRRNPPALCWLSSKPTPRRSDRKEQPMNLIEKALRYIYIYILTSKAGLEYDLQSREVWRGRKPKSNSSYLYSHRRLRLWSEVFFKWRAGFISQELYNRIDHGFDRRRDYVLHRFLRRYNVTRCRWFAGKGLFIFDVESLFLSTSLTSKEVAA